MTIPTRPNIIFAYYLPLLVLACCTGLLLWSHSQAMPADRISTAITLDLTVTAPLLYLIGIRRSAIPRSTVIRVFVIGMVLAGWLLRDRPHTLLQGMKTWLAPVLEAVILLMLAFKIRKLRRQLADSAYRDLDFLARCRMALGQILGSEKVGGLMASEIAVIYYGLLPRRRIVPGPASFSNYRENGVLTLLSIFLLMFFVEGTAMHVLIAHWSAPIAWLLTGLSAYTALQLFAHMRAIRARTIVIGEQTLYLRNGLAGDAVIDLDDILTVELSRNKLPAGGKSMSGKAGRQECPQVIQLSLLKSLETHNILVHLKRPITVTRFFGIKSQTETILFFVDEPDRFIGEINEKLK